jgi:hypothetical protein
VPAEASVVGWQQELAPAGWKTGLAFCRQQGMLHSSVPAQAGATTAARRISASRTRMHLAPVDFIVSNYKFFLGHLSSRK